MSSVMWHLLPTERETSLHKGTSHLCFPVKWLQWDVALYSSPRQWQLTRFDTRLSFESLKVSKLRSMDPLSLCNVKSSTGEVSSGASGQSCKLKCKDSLIIIAFGHSEPIIGRFVLCFGRVEGRHCGEVFAQSIWWTTLGLGSALHPSHHFCWNFGLVSFRVHIM